MEQQIKIVYDEHRICSSIVNQIILNEHLRSKKLSGSKTAAMRAATLRVDEIVDSVNELVTEAISTKGDSFSEDLEEMRISYSGKEVHLGNISDYSFRTIMDDQNERVPEDPLPNKLYFWEYGNSPAHPVVVLHSTIENPHRKGDAPAIALKDAKYSSHLYLDKENALYYLHQMWKKVMHAGIGKSERALLSNRIYDIEKEEYYTIRPNSDGIGIEFDCFITKPGEDLSLADVLVHALLARTNYAEFVKYSSGPSFVDHIKTDILPKGTYLAIRDMAFALLFNGKDGLNNAEVTIVDHQTLSPHRKPDPGPNMDYFILEKVLEEIHGDEEPIAQQRLLVAGKEWELGGASFRYDGDTLYDVNGKLDSDEERGESDFDFSNEENEAYNKKEERDFVSGKAKFVKHGLYKPELWAAAEAKNQKFLAAVEAGTIKFEKSIND